MSTASWWEEIPAAVTVTDAEGIIIEMNQKAAATFSKSGGKALIGKQLLDCHPAQAQEKIKQIQHSTQANIYTIEKKGVKKLIYQTPYFENGKYSGLVEISFELPEEAAHFIRE